LLARTTRLVDLRWALAFVQWLEQVPAPWHLLAWIKAGEQLRDRRERLAVIDAPARRAG
jgi:hypothetical protein